jgi:hypothetical protein
MLCSLRLMRHLDTLLVPHLHQLLQKQLHQEMLEVLLLLCMRRLHHHRNAHQHPRALHLHHPNTL